MKVLNKKLPESFNLFLFGDIHIGSMLCYERGVEKMIEEINKESEFPNFAVDHGDQIEGILMDDKRFSLETTKELSILKQCDRVVELLEPIKSKLLVMLDGNHPRKLWRYGDLAKSMADKLGVSFGTYSCILRYQSEESKKIMFQHYTTHGFGSISSKAKPRSRAEANMSITLMDKLNMKISDCYLRTMGHTHKLIIRKPDDFLNIYVDKSGELQEKYIADIKFRQYQTFIPNNICWYVNTGCFLRTLQLGISSYGEIAGYDPLQLGYAVAEIRNGRLVNVEERRA